MHHHGQHSLYLYLWSRCLCLRRQHLLLANRPHRRRLWHSPNLPGAAALAAAALALTSAIPSWESTIAALAFALALAFASAFALAASAFALTTTAFASVAHDVRP